MPDLLHRLFFRKDVDERLEHIVDGVYDDPVQIHDRHGFDLLEKIRHFSLRHPVKKL